ncbi:MBL fold metallo-hydrolase [Vibrio sp. S9_S30]|uniref:MBL fold metallo-hydrolase n=1 Tax=Vibrio sp. S9_S30 TaxID=2720226 RepID=UPI0016816CCE|nr:MBL fold metallo-hydrolase [Vibrio sp. S9_S30]MBD1555894.1 MBL fold metallo-hydrolase [Vibrio sp. S9_S30]
MQLKPLRSLAPLYLALISTGAMAHHHNQEIYFPDVGQVKAEYVSPSITQSIQPGQKIDNLFELQFDNEKATIQKLGNNTYWVGVNYYNTTVVVDKKAGVMLIDPLGADRVATVLKAVKQITNKPITAMVYSHYHLDHVEGASAIQDYVDKNQSEKLEIYASQAVYDKIMHHTTRNDNGEIEAKIPLPTKVQQYKRGKTIKFGDQRVRFIAPKGHGHTPDNTMIWIQNDKVMHFADMINPDQLPFYNFAGAENFHGYEEDLRFLLKKGERGHWKYVNGGHGNIGSPEDVRKLLEYIEDLRTEVGKQLNIAPYQPQLADGNHFIWVKRWQDSISAGVREALEPKYGHMYGFNSGAVETHAIKVLFDMIDH